MHHELGLSQSQCKFYVQARLAPPPSPSQFGQQVTLPFSCLCVSGAVPQEVHLRIDSGLACSVDDGQA